MSKNLGISPDYILNELSYENLIMYGYSLPTYNSDGETDEWDDSIDANNPDNFKDLADEEEVNLNSATHIVRNKFKILSNNILPSILPCQKIHLT